MKTSLRISFSLCHIYGQKQGCTLQYITLRLQNQQKSTPEQEQILIKIIRG